MWLDHAIKSQYHDSMENVNVKLLVETLGGQAFIARELGIARQSVWQWVKDNRLPNNYSRRLELHNRLRDLQLSLPEEHMLSAVIYAKPGRS